MKPFDDKWVQSLANPIEDNQKRYKSLLSIRKFYKEQPDQPSYSHILNQHSSAIFFLVTDKLSKVPTSTLEKIVTLNSSAQQIPEILGLLEDLFLYTEKNAVKDLHISSHIRIVIILHRLLDLNTKREVRKAAFLFLLKILESFDDYSQIDKEYIALFNYSLESPALRDGASHIPAYQFTCNITTSSPNSSSLKAATEYFNEYDEFQDIGKLIAETSPTIKYDEIAKETFATFLDFVKGKKDKANLWFTIFLKNWMDIFFNENNIEDHSTFSIFEEVKRKGMTPNLPLQKQHLTFLWNSLKDESSIRTSQELFALMKAVRVFYSQSSHKPEVNKILSIYHLFVTNRFNFLNENSFDDEICHRIIKDMEILCLRHVEDEITPAITMSSVPNLESNSSEKRKDLSHPSTPIISSSTPENMSFKILSDILKYHGRKHAKEIFNTVSSVLTRVTSENKNIAMESLYPLIEILFTSIARSEPPDRDEYLKGFIHYLEHSEVVSRIMAFILKKTEALQFHIRHDAYQEALSSMTMIDGSGKRYQMMTEYLPQLLLQYYCDKCVKVVASATVQSEKNEKNEEQSPSQPQMTRHLDHKYFVNEANENKLLYVEVKEGLWDNPDAKQILSELEEQFAEWLSCFVLLYDIELLKTKPSFTVVCKGIVDIIDLLIEPETTNSLLHHHEKGKLAGKPIYPMPTETLYQIFGYFFANTIYIREKPRMEGKLWAIKGYLDIFCHTRSEIQPNRLIIKDVTSFIYSVFRVNFFREDDLEIYMMNCVLIRSTEKIFGTDYPGIRLLISHYYRAMEQILFTENFSQLEKNALDMLGSVILDHEYDGSKESQQLILLETKISCLNILKSLVFLGYLKSELKIIGLPESRFDRGKQGTKVVREETFVIVYRLLEKNRKLVPKTGKQGENYDLKFQYNLMTLAGLIIRLEGQSTRPNSAALDISLENFIDKVLQQMSFDVANVDIERIMLSIRLANALAFLMENNMRYYIKIFKEMITLMTNAIINLSKEESTPQKKTIISELLFVTLRWLICDNKGILFTEESIFNSIENMIQTFAENNSYPDDFEIFFNTLFINYRNFPLRTQSKDNTKSIFEETSFKALDTKYFDLLNSISASNASQASSNMNDSMILRSVSEKTEVVRPKPGSLSSIGSYDDSILKKVLKSPDKDKDDVKEGKRFESKQEEFLFMFRYLWISYEEVKQLLLMKEKELIDSLNTQINNFTPERQVKNSMFFSYKDNTLISLVTPTSRTQGGRVIFRNISGRYAWEFSQIHGIKASALEKTIKSFDELNESFVAFDTPNLFQEDAAKKGVSIKGGMLPKRAMSEKFEHRDPFKELFQYVKENVTDYEEFDVNDILEEKGPNDSQDIIEGQFDDLYEKVIDFEARRNKFHQRSAAYDLLRRKDAQEISENRVKIPLLQNTLSLGGYDGIRLLFSHLKILNLNDDFQLNVLQNENNNGRLQTSINLLDSTFARESIKIAVIYVARGQDNQKEILKNSSGSKMYEEFLESLGERVSLKSHLGFTAGLKHKLDGETAIYYSNPLTELTFHVATLMPTEVDDDQVLNKKRHVGNDHVSIIWCENYREYRRNTITSQYNFVQIVIYPMKFDLYKVTINKKDNINFLFPWIDNVVVSKEHLSLIVKLCAIHGFRRSRFQNDFPFQSYQKRNTYLNQFHGLSATNNMNIIRGEEDPWSVISSLTSFSQPIPSTEQL